MNIRNYGIDLLRIISIIMITALHIIVPGIGQYAFYNGTPSIKIIYAICICGVNCFLLISGYVNLYSKFKLSRIIKILLEALFYNLVLTIIISIINDTLTVQRIIESFDILGNSNWWFLRAYLILFIVMPIINEGIKNSNKSILIIVVLLLIFFISILGVIKGDVFYSGDGYSALWFIVVYVIGACIKKYENIITIKRTNLILIFTISTIITIVSFYIIYNYNCTHIETYIPENLLYQYISPTILMNSVALLLIFKDVVFAEKVNKIIKFATPSIFSVYLFQCQHLIYKYYFPDRFSFLNTYNNKLFIYIPLLAIFITILLILLDQIRIVFFKICKLNHLYNYIDSKINIK